MILHEFAFKYMFFVLHMWSWKILAQSDQGWEDSDQMTDKSTNTSKMVNKIIKDD
jgi:hypothetical protein